MRAGTAAQAHRSGGRGLASPAGARVAGARGGWQPVELFLAARHATPCTCTATRAPCEATVATLPLDALEQERTTTVDAVKMKKEILW